MSRLIYNHLKLQACKTTGFFLLSIILIRPEIALAQPMAVLYVGNQQNVGYSVCFDGADSYGDSGDSFAEKDEIVNYIWDFGDGSKTSGDYLNTTTHVYSAPGTYTVTLQVVDHRGESDVTTSTITVGTLPRITVAGNTTSAIQKAISELGGQAGIVYLPAGAYQYDGTVNVPSGVIIQGDGMGETRVHTASSGTEILFSAVGNNVRLTGLTLEGFSGDPFETSNRTFGIVAYNDKKNVFIDHCEALAFILGIDVKYRSSATIENCYIHHNTTNGYGYGVSVAGEAYAMVRYNELSNCRHVITSGGTGDGGVTAAPTRFDFLYNHIQGYRDVENKGYQVDAHAGMHGRMRINFNLFEDLRGGISFRDGFNIEIKGNTFRNIDPREESSQYGNAINTHAPTGTGGWIPDTPGVDGLTISGNTFENNSHDLWLEFGKNIIVNGRHMDAQIPYRGNIDWNENPTLTITTASFPTAIIGRNYSASLQVVEGQAPYRWTLINGELPNGLRLNESNGEIYGVPQQIQESAFAIQVTDADNATVGKLLSLTVSAAMDSHLDAILNSHVTVDADLYEYVFANSISFSDNSGRGLNKDNQAGAKLMWDNSNLYIGVEIMDSELYAFVDQDDNSSLYTDDCIEVFIDPHNDGGAVMQTDDYRYTVNLNDKVLDGNGFKEWSWNGDLKKSVAIKGTLNQNNAMDTGSIIEVAIPWSDLGVTPTNGHTLGLQLGVTDLDEEGDYEYFGWPLDNESFNNPDRWAKVTLTEGPTELVAGITLSDPSPAKAGSHVLTLATSKAVTKIPASLVLTESDGTTTTIALTGPAPGSLFTGTLVIDDSIAEGVGTFSLSPGALQDESGRTSNTIISGATIEIDKTPPAQPTGLSIDFQP